ncbi:MAG: hypothetical protein LBU85_08380 [Treponema sp.]|jgi:hypothetical protein|nr:hypothetical protein [Treponema sp.]
MKDNSAKQSEYEEKTKSYAASVEQLLKETQDVDALLKQGTMPDPEFMKIKLSITMLTLVSNYLAMYQISVPILGQQKSENLLNEARKSMHKCLVYLEEVVTNIVDAPFSDYEEGLAKIAAVSPTQRYSLVEKIGQQLINLKEAYGKNSKWTWTFVELEGRYAVVAKNLINLRDYFVNSDFESPHYEPTVRHIKKVRELLEQSADGYRKKYELSTKAIEDFQKGINYLSALKRLDIFTGDQESAVTTKKKIETWTAKMTADAAAQKKEQAARR